MKATLISPNVESKHDPKTYFLRIPVGAPESVEQLAAPVTAGTHSERSHNNITLGDIFEARGSRQNIRNNRFEEFEWTAVLTISGLVEVPENLAYHIRKMQELTRFRIERFLIKYPKDDKNDRYVDIIDGSEHSIGMTQDEINLGNRMSILLTDGKTRRIVQTSTKTFLDMQVVTLPLRVRGFLQPLVFNRLTRLPGVILTTS